MTTDFVATEPVWMVLVERVELIGVEVGQQFTSSQVCEQYDTQAAAEARMVGLDPDWTSDDPDESDDPLQYNVI
jgi:hypothetical protein